MSERKHCERLKTGWGLKIELNDLANAIVELHDALESRGGDSGGYDIRYVAGPPPAEQGAIGETYLPPGMPDMSRGHWDVADERAAWRSALRARTREGTDDRLRLDMAKQALINPGGFKPGTVSDDIAPRIIELASERDAARRERDEARGWSELHLSEKESLRKRLGEVEAMLREPEKYPGLTMACAIAGHKTCSVSEPTENGTWVPATLRAVLDYAAKGDK